MLSASSVEMRFDKRVNQLRQMQVVSQKSIFVCSMESNLTVAPGPIPQSVPSAGHHRVRKYLYVKL